jgi:hypothetical protein
MNDQTTHEMNEQTEVPLQQSGTCANVSQQLVPAAASEGATLATKTAHQLTTCSHSMNNLWQCQSFVDAVLIDSWQYQMEINKVKSMKTAQSAIGSMCKSFQSCGPCHNKKIRASWKQCFHSTSRQHFHFDCNMPSMSLQFVKPSCHKNRGCDKEAD